MTRTLAALGLSIALTSLGCSSWSDFERVGTGGSGGTGGGSMVCAPGEARECYSGPKGTIGVGLCKVGVETCLQDGSKFGPCAGEIVPHPETCATPGDDDCEGTESVCEGKTLWARRFGDDAEQLAASVATDANGDVFAAGPFMGTLDLGVGIPVLKSAGGQRAFVAKLNLDGVPQWGVVLGELESDARLAASADGDIVVAGQFVGTMDLGGGLPSMTSDADADAFAARLSTDGAPTWAGQFVSNGNPLSKVALDAAGNVLLAGPLPGTIDLGDGLPQLSSAGGSDVFVAKLRADGVPLWGRRFGDSAQQGAASVAADSSGNVFVTGNVDGTVDLGAGLPVLTSAGATDAFLVKLDADGVPLWAHFFGDAQTQSGAAVAVDSTGAVVVVGTFEGAIDLGKALPVLTSVGAGDVFVVKLDASGEPLWARSFGDDKVQTAAGVAVDSTGAVVVLGTFDGAIDFGKGLPMVASAGGSDVFVVKLDASGIPLWARSFGDVGYQRGTAIAVDLQSNVLVAGYFKGTIDPGNGIAPMTADGEADVFVVKLSQ